MSAKKSETIIVAVKGGDAIPTNRLLGKSNTGTYFISSMNNWEDFKYFFKENDSTIYKLDKRHLLVYKILFKKFFFKKRDLYSDKMKFFEDICDSLLLNPDDIFIKFELRINDTRIFLRFSNNNDKNEYALRGIIYSDFTNLVFTKDNNILYFYPEINFDLILNNQISEEVNYELFRN